VEPRFAAHAGASLIALLIALPADASPKRADAKKLFDKALTAYGNDDFAGAADALAKSFKLEADPDTLFAWAQAERKLGDCAKAIELYDKLLKFDLPQENKDAVSDSRTECVQQIDAANKSKPVPTPTETPTPTQTPTPTETPTPPKTPPGKPDLQNKDVDSPFAKQGGGGGEGSHAWWKDPVGDTLVLVGIAGIGVGTGFLVSASSANSALKTASTFGDAQTFHDQANSQGKIGVIAASAGVAFIAGGIVWYATHRHRDARPAVTGWIGPSGGGLAIAGGF
jgi:tetratricopeptide (TPR) repeat protein